MSRCTDVEITQVWYDGGDPSKHSVSEVEVVFTYDDGTSETIMVQAPR